MTNLELQKMANEVRKDIVTAVHQRKVRPSGRFPVGSRCVYISVF